MAKVWLDGRILLGYLHTAFSVTLVVEVPGCPVFSSSSIIVAGEID